MKKLIALTALPLLLAVSASAQRSQGANPPVVSPITPEPAQKIRDQEAFYDRASGETLRGFKTIFNGRNLKGWNGNPEIWSVKDGAIVGQTTAEKPIRQNTFLIWTNGAPADFELRVLYKLIPNNDKGAANSGIQYRSKVLDEQNWVVGGYQADFEAGPNYSGILYEEKMSRGIMALRGEKVVWTADGKKQVVGSVGDPAEIQAAIRKNDWNEYVIIARGNHLQHFINGHQTVDVIDETADKRASEGIIAFQIHTGPPMTVMFKDVRLREVKGKK